LTQVVAAAAELRGLEISPDVQEVQIGGVVMAQGVDVVAAADAGVSRVKAVVGLTMTVREHTIPSVRPVKVNTVGLVTVTV